MGNAHPSVFPYEPLPDRRQRPDRGRRPTTGSSASCCERARRSRSVADDPRFARNADRTANREELRPLLVERLATRAGASGSSC